MVVARLDTEKPPSLQKLVMVGEVVLVRSMDVNYNYDSLQNASETRDLLCTEM